MTYGPLIDNYTSNYIFNSINNAFILMNNKTINNSSNKIDSIQIMRAIAALMVLFAHFITDAIKYNKINSSFYILKPFLLKGVDIFFFISGFIITLLYLTKNDTLATFIKKRGIRILPTYYIFTLLAFGMWIIKPTFFNNSVGNRTDILASFLLMPSKPEYLHLLSVTWTLCFEIWFYLFFAISIAFFRKKIFIPIALYSMYLSILPILSNYGINMPNSTFFHLLNSPYCLEFLAGGIFCYIYSFKNFKALLILVLALAGLGISNTDMLLFTILSIILFLALEFGGKYLPEKIAKFLILIGDSSYSLYLSHLLVMGAVKHIWEKSGFRTGEMAHLLWIGSMLMGPIVFNWIYYKLIDQKINQYLHKKFL